MNYHRVSCHINLLALSVTALGLVACSGGSPGGSPGFTLSASALTPNPASAGGSATSTIQVASLFGYAGAVNLSCTITDGSPAPSAPAPTCTFSTPVVTITNSTSAAVQMTVTIANSTAGGTFDVSVSGVGADGLAPSNGPQQLTLKEAGVIKHVVIIFQENRSTDNLFHDPVLIARGADIASSGVNSFGNTIPLTPIDLGTVGPNPQDYDLVHSHAAWVLEYDGGKMDGANLVPCNPVSACKPPAHPNAQFHYVEPTDVAPYFALAEQYTFADRMFQTHEGPSFPAHQFIISGTSAPTATSTLFDSENATESITEPSGCLSPLGTLVKMIDAQGSEDVPEEYPCFEHPTLTDLLQTDGHTWRYYTPSAGTIWTGPVAINHMCQEQTINSVRTCTGPDWSNVIIPQTRFLSDIANGELADVTWIIPDGADSDHAASNNGTGPFWVASLVNAIGNSPYWANTAIFITWDDWGGWFDHVQPRVINDGVSWGSGYAYGFRVPLIVVSPYAKKAYVSHVEHDFGSVLKYIETLFQLPSLGYADTPADDLSDCFDMTQAPTVFQPIPSALNAAYFLKRTDAAVDPDDD